jgi:uncharacterized protein (DUF1800 family)
MTFQRPDDAWERLPNSEWNEAAARHLLRRAGWTARSEETARIHSGGLEEALDLLFPTTPISIGKTPLILKFEADVAKLRQKGDSATGRDKQSVQRDLREQSQAALQEFGIKWLQTARMPEHASFAKWILFLSDVYVVSAQKVRHAGFIWRHFDLLGQHAFDRAPALTKAVSRSPAMAMYLDLDRSDKAAPNENFARELFELFVLGEGNYTEQDIKEAARAFTGYRVNRLTGAFQVNPRQHDGGPKTVFGKTDRLNGDDVIDLAYEQSSAAEFLPRELARFYLSDEPLPANLIRALAARWKTSGYDLRVLARDFFGSRLFYAPEYRGNFIKSPVQFYLGIMQDLELSVPPLARYSTSRLRQMGQALFQPPNVRGWLGGRTWINSSTLAVRRQLAEQLFSSIREQTLNADEMAALANARLEGVSNFSVSADWIRALLQESSPGIASRLAMTFLPGNARPEMLQALSNFLENKTDNQDAAERLRTALIALLQTPEYQLC